MPLIHINKMEENKMTSLQKMLTQGCSEVGTRRRLKSGNMQYVQAVQRPEQLLLLGCELSVSSFATCWRRLYPIEVV